MQYSRSLNRMDSTSINRPEKQTKLCQRSAIHKVKLNPTYNWNGLYGIYSGWNITSIEICASSQF